MGILVKAAENCAPEYASFVDMVSLADDAQAQRNKTCSTTAALSVSVKPFSSQSMHAVQKQIHTKAQVLTSFKSTFKNQGEKLSKKTNKKGRTKISAKSCLCASASLHCTCLRHNNFDPAWHCRNPPLSSQRNSRKTTHSLSGRTSCPRTGRRFSIREISSE